MLLLKVALKTLFEVELLVLVSYVVFVQNLV